MYVLWFPIFSVLQFFGCIIEERILFTQWMYNHFRLINTITNTFYLEITPASHLPGPPEKFPMSVWLYLRNRTENNLSRMMYIHVSKLYLMIMFLILFWCCQNWTIIFINWLCVFHIAIEHSLVDITLYDSLIYILLSSIDKDFHFCVGVRVFNKLSSFLC